MREIAGNYVGNKRDFPVRTPPRLSFGLRLTKTGNTIPIFPLIAFLENLDAFEAFQNVAFGAQSAGALKTTMLSHKIVFSSAFPCEGRDLYHRRG